MQLVSTSYGIHYHGSMGYTITAHNSQGQTMDDVIIDFSGENKGKTSTSAGIFYVAAMRVKKLSSLLNSF